MAIVAGHGLQLQVQPPKVDMDNVAGAAVPFFFVKGTTEAHGVYHCQGGGMAGPCLQKQREN